jgi:hypothetical protein
MSAIGVVRGASERASASRHPVGGLALRDHPLFIPVRLNASLRRLNHVEEFPNHLVRNPADGAFCNSRLLAADVP